MKKLLSLILAVMMLPVLSAAAGEGADMTSEEWYQQMLADSEMNLGNNARLKKVIEKARNGEHITLAVIGGSITEGAGAKTYAECWASRLWKRFGAAFGTDNGSNVHLVNAGVGGTGSPFGYMRYQREIVDRVAPEDTDGLPDLIVIEYSVNDWEEPTNHRCYESMVRDILEAPNEPAVILLFAVFRNGWNLQDELKKIGAAYDLMMVSIRDGVYKHIDKEIPSSDFFYDEYHPTSLGHRIMTDCIMKTLTDAADAETASDPDLNVKSVFGLDFRGLKTIFGDTVSDEFTIVRGGFSQSDAASYRNKPVGQVCGKNFYHGPKDSDEPLKVTGIFRKCLIAWKASPDSSFGTAEVLIDGVVKKTLRGGSGKWGQSEVVLALDDRKVAMHTLEIRVTDPGKKFTITAIGLE